MKAFIYRRGNGNEGNLPRFMVELTDAQCPYAALSALVANDYETGSPTRRHIIKSAEIDGESEFGINATVYEGRNGESEFGAAWLTAELEPVLQCDREYCQSRYETKSLRDALDNAAWRLYCKKAKV